MSTRIKINILLTVCAILIVGIVGVGFYGITQSTVAFESNHDNFQAIQNITSGRFLQIESN